MKHFVYVFGSHALDFGLRHTKHERTSRTELSVTTSIYVLVCAPYESFVIKKCFFCV